jgi:hypothetical protein
MELKIQEAFGNSAKDLHCLDSKELVIWHLNGTTKVERN